MAVGSMIVDRSLVGTSAAVMSCVLKNVRSFGAFGVVAAAASSAASVGAESCPARAVAPTGTGMNGAGWPARSAA